MRLIRRIRRYFCLHEWDCRWSRLCKGDHECIKCGKRGTQDD